MIKIAGKDTEVSRIFYGTAAEPFQSGGDGTDLIEQMVNIGVFMLIIIFIKLLI